MLGAPGSSRSRRPHPQRCSTSECGICGSDGATCDRYTRYSTVYRYRYRNCTVLVARSEPLGVCDRSSHGRVRPNLSLSGQVSVGAKHRATPVLCPVIGRSRPRWWSLSLCLSAEALVHVAEATSIVAEATTLITYIRRKKYTLSLTSVCHLLALTDNNNRGSSVTHSQLTYVPLGVRARRVTNLPCDATGRGCCPFAFTQITLFVIICPIFLSAHRRWLFNGANGLHPNCTLSRAVIQHIATREQYLVNTQKTR